MHTQTIKENVKTAGLTKVKVIVGPGHASMQAMPCDLVFINANNTNYFVEAKRLLRVGGVIVRIWISLANRIFADRGQCGPLGGSHCVLTRPNLSLTSGLWSLS